MLVANDSVSGVNSVSVGSYRRVAGRVQWRGEAAAVFRKETHQSRHGHTMLGNRTSLAARAIKLKARNHVTH